MQPEEMETYVIEQTITVLQLDDTAIVYAANSYAEQWLLIIVGIAAYVMEIGSDDDEFIFNRVVGDGPDTISFPIPE